MHALYISVTSFATNSMVFFFQFKHVKEHDIFDLCFLYIKNIEKVVMSMRERRKAAPLFFTGSFKHIYTSL